MTSSLSFPSVQEFVPFSKREKFYDPRISPVNKIQSVKKSQRLNKSKFAQELSSFWNFEVANNKTTQGHCRRIFLTALKSQNQNDQFVIKFYVAQNIISIRNGMA